MRLHIAEQLLAVVGRDQGVLRLFRCFPLASELIDLRLFLV